MNRLSRLFSLVAVLLLAACGGGGGGGAPFGGTAPGGGGGGSSGGTAADLVLTLSSSTINSASGAAVTATAVAVDANRNTVASVPVTFSANNNGVVTPAGTATNASGVVTATIGIGADSSNRTITVTATSGGISKSLSLLVSNSATTGGAASLTVTLSSSSITSATPATVTATLRDTQGNPVTGTVVTLTTGRGTLAVPNVSSLLTNAQGVATATLRSSGSGVEGADQLIATASIGGATVQGQVGFTVLADSPTLSISPSTQSIRYSTGGGSVTVTARDAAGAAQAGVLVSFSVANGLVSLGTASALTDTSGNASVTVRPLAPSSSGVEIVSASATVGGRSLISRATIQVTGEAPALVVGAVSSSSITQTAPATLRVVARDLQGNLLSGTVVTFRSGSGLVTFTPTTQATNTQGEATVVVAPANASSNGAEMVTASITVQGVTATAQQLFQVTATTPTGTPTLTLELSGNSISSASPATVTATLKDAQGSGVPGQVVAFSVSRGLATTNIPTALTQGSGPNLGSAIVILSPASATSAGADDVVASVTYGGVTLTRSLGFQVQATPVTLGALTATTNPLSAYGQTDLSLAISGASVTSPVSISVTSSCVAQGKATLSPASFTATSASVTMQYRDNGCGAVQANDQLQAVVTATGATSSLTLPIAAPAESSIAFVSAAPEQIYLRGSGFTETSLITFEVRDAAGNPLPNRVVELRLQTGAGGVTMEGRGVESINPASSNPFTLTSNAQGRVSARVNSGTLPTPVRVHARLQASPLIATVSSNLSVAIGLPSQLNFSFSQGTRNIEGYEIDGTPNTYQIIASDRSGNPVAAGTSINFVSEGGQIEAIKQIQIVNLIARTTANFVSSSPRPIDGRITVTAYSLGEESFIDVNGNNAWDLGEPFQDLGNIFKDRTFDGLFDDASDEYASDEYVSLNINNTSACVVPTNPLLFLDASIPSISAATAPSLPAARQNTCDGTWSGAGQVYVRRALETVLSTSGSRPLWLPSETRLLGTGSLVRLQVGSRRTSTSVYRAMGGDTLCTSAVSGTFTFLVGDANPGRPKSPFVDPLTDYDQFPRLNPMAAGTTIVATSPTTGFAAATVAGSPVASTTEASPATISYNFTDTSVQAGTVAIAFTSPQSRTISSVTVQVARPGTAGCP